jgi:hypothetical protein
MYVRPLSLVTVISLVSPPSFPYGADVVFFSFQKFKIRIEDPPRRKHMVFFGGGHHEGTRRVFGIKEEWYKEGMRSFEIEELRRL